MAHSPEFCGARQECADAVASNLFDLERSIERSLATTAHVVTTVLTSREPLGLSVLHGQQLLNDTLALASLLNSARETVGALHKTAALTQRQIGVRTISGNPGDKPDDGSGFMPQAFSLPRDLPLRRVA